MCIRDRVLVNTATAGNITITQGLLQPSKPSSGVGLSESQFIFDHVTIYPNPTENLFYLSADFNDKGEIHTLLYDMNGKIIDDKKIPVSYTHLDVYKRQICRGLYLTRKNKNR